MVRADGARGTLAGICVVDADDVVRSVLVAQVRALDPRATSYESVTEYADAADPDEPSVVVFGPSARPTDTIAAVEKLGAFRPGFGAVMVVEGLSATLLQNALRAGVDDVVTTAAEDDELLDAVSRAFGRVDARRPVLPRKPAAEVRRQGRVVTVFCAKGGAGKSVLATNVAAALAKRVDGPVVLVDADMQFGDVALMLQLEPAHTVLEAVEAGELLDSSLLESLLLQDGASGLKVLAAPTESRAADGIGRADLVRILELLRQQYAYVVVDTSASFADVTLAALQESDEILVLASLDVMSLKSAKVGLQTMRILDIDSSKVRFVLNRANTRVGLSEADAERTLRLKVDTALPSELVVAESVNRGVPAVLGAPRSRFARNIDALADRLVSAAGASRSQDG